MTKSTRTFLKALSHVKEDTYRRVLDAISLKRRNPAISLTKAAKSSGTTLTTVRRHAPSVLNVRSGRLDVRTTDRLHRRMRLLTSRGEIVISTTSSRTASRISRYMNSVRAFYVTQDPSVFKPFQGKHIRSKGETYEFVTDPTTLNRLARAGAVHFLDIYAPEAAL